MKRTQNKASEFALAKDQIQRIFNAAKTDRDHVLFQVLYYCALRRAEAAALDVRDIDFQNGVLHVRSGKGDKERTVPVKDSLLAGLRRLTNGRIAGPVFFSRQKKDRGVSTSRINALLAQAAKDAGVSTPNPRRKDVNPHLLRHSFARHYLDAGGSLRGLSSILGHSSVATTGDVYGTPSIAFLENEYHRVVQ